MHHMNVNSNTPPDKLTQHMCRTLEEDGEFTVSAVNGRPLSTMEWSIASLHGFFPGYVVSHSQIEQVKGDRGDNISVVQKHVWIAKEEDKRDDRDNNEAKEDPNEGDANEPNQECRRWHPWSRESRR